MTENAPAEVGSSNVEQLSEWDGDAGAYWAAHADRFEEGLAGYHDQFLAAAAIEATTNVLDIGCGNGQTTRDAARCAAGGSALGVDLSSRATFLQADAQVHPFPDQTFDIAISRHGAMFFGDPAVAFANIAEAMCSGGA
ncbi:MAG TPA: class I SAM-dependent methyltransferase [Pseudonocardiaceae bacterium]|jgi:SAM-dependent methyltransferase|nr:class I SAM-dependent methyltransferase [Pseudonocardiaceae bacterium]